MAPKMSKCANAALKEPTAFYEAEAEEKERWNGVSRMLEGQLEQAVQTQVANLQQAATLSHGTFPPALPGGPLGDPLALGHELWAIGIWCSGGQPVRPGGQHYIALTKLRPAKHMGDWSISE